MSLPNQRAVAHVDDTAADSLGVDGSNQQHDQRHQGALISSEQQQQQQQQHNHHPTIAPSSVSGGSYGGGSSSEGTSITTSQSLLGHEEVDPIILEFVRNRNREIAEAEKYAAQVEQERKKVAALAAAKKKKFQTPALADHYIRFQRQNTATIEDADGHRLYKLKKKFALFTNKYLGIDSSWHRRYRDGIPMSAFSMNWNTGMYLVGYLEEHFLAYSFGGFRSPIAACIFITLLLLSMGVVLEFAAPGGKYSTLVGPYFMASSGVLLLLAAGTKLVELYFDRKLSDLDEEQRKIVQQELDAQFSVAGGPTGMSIRSGGGGSSSGVATTEVLADGVFQQPPTGGGGGGEFSVGEVSTLHIQTNAAAVQTRRNLISSSAALAAAQATAASKVIQQRIKLRARMTRAVEIINLILLLLFTLSFTASSFRLQYDCAIYADREFISYNSCAIISVENLVLPIIFASVVTLRRFQWRICAYVQSFLIVVSPFVKLSHLSLYPTKYAWNEQTAIQIVYSAFTGFLAAISVFHGEIFQRRRFEAYIELKINEKEAKKKMKHTTSLIESVLPGASLEQLVTFQPIHHAGRDAVVAMSRISKFPVWSSQFAITTVPEILNAMYSAFDTHRSKFGLQLVSNMGDSYVVSTLADPRSSDSTNVHRQVRLALAQRGGEGAETSGMRSVNTHGSLSQHRHAQSGGAALANSAGSTLLGGGDTFSSPFAATSSNDGNHQQHPHCRLNPANFASTASAGAPPSTTARHQQGDANTVIEALEGGGNHSSTNTHIVVSSSSPDRGVPNSVVAAPQFVPPETAVQRTVRCITFCTKMLVVVNKLSQGIREVAGENASNHRLTGGVPFALQIGVTTGTVLGGLFGTDHKLFWNCTGPAFQEAQKLCTESGNGQIFVGTPAAEATINRLTYGLASVAGAGGVGGATSSERGSKQHHGQGTTAPLLLSHNNSSGATTSVTGPPQQHQQQQQTANQNQQQLLRLQLKSLKAPSSMSRAATERLVRAAYVATATKAATTGTGIVDLSFAPDGGVGGGGGTGGFSTTDTPNFGGGTSSGFVPGSSRSRVHIPGTGSISAVMADPNLVLHPHGAADGADQRSEARVDSGVGKGSEGGSSSGGGSSAALSKPVNSVTGQVTSRKDRLAARSKQLSKHDQRVLFMRRFKIGAFASDGAALNNEEEKLTQQASKQQMGSSDGNSSSNKSRNGKSSSNKNSEKKHQALIVSRQNQLTRIASEALLDLGQNPESFAVTGESTKQRQQQQEQEQEGLQPSSASGSLSAEPYGQEDQASDEQQIDVDEISVDGEAHIDPEILSREVSYMRYHFQFWSCSPNFQNPEAERFYWKTITDEVFRGSRFMMVVIPTVSTSSCAIGITDESWPLLGAILMNMLITLVFFNIPRRLFSLKLLFYGGPFLQTILLILAMALEPKGNLFTVSLGWLGMIAGLHFYESAICVCFVTTLVLGEVLAVAIFIINIFRNPDTALLSLITAVLLPFLLYNAGFVREKQRRQRFLMFYQSEQRLQEAEVERGVHEALLLRVLPEYVVPVVAKRLGARGEDVGANGCVVDALSDVALLNVRLHLPNMSSTFSHVDLATATIEAVVMQHLQQQEQQRAAAAAAAGGKRVATVVSKNQGSVYGGGDGQQQSLTSASLAAGDESALNTTTNDDDYGASAMMLNSNSAMILPRPGSSVIGGGNSTTMSSLFGGGDTISSSKTLSTSILRAGPLAYLERIDSLITNAFDFLEKERALLFANGEVSTRQSSVSVIRVLGDELCLGGPLSHKRPQDQTKGAQQQQSAAGGVVVSSGTGKSSQSGVEKDEDFAKLMKGGKADETAREILLVGGYIRDRIRSTAVYGRGDSTAVVFGDTEPRFDLVGAAPRVNAALVDAAPEGSQWMTRSFEMLIPPLRNGEADRRAQLTHHHRDAHPASITESSTTITSTSGGGGGLSPSSPPVFSSENPHAQEVLRKFGTWALGAQSRWRVRGCGIVEVTQITSVTGAAKVGRKKRAGAKSKNSSTSAGPPTLRAVSNPLALPFGDEDEDGSGAGDHPLSHGNASLSIEEEGDAKGREGHHENVSVKGGGEVGDTTKSTATDKKIGEQQQQNHDHHRQAPTSSSAASGEAGGGISSSSQNISVRSVDQS